MDLTDAIIDYRRFLKRKNYSAHTVKNIINRLKHFVVWLPVPLEQTRYDHIKQYIEMLMNKRRAPVTINCQLASIRGFFDYLFDEGQLCMPNPVKKGCGVRGSHPLPRFLKDEQLDKLFAVVKRLRDRAMFMLMLRCGLRVEEVAKLSMEALDLSSRRIRVESGKGQKDRIVYICHDAQECLHRYLRIRHAVRCRNVFVVEKGSFRGKPLSVRGIQKRMEHYARKAKLRASCHQLRHTMATQMLNADAPLVSIQDLLGHNWIMTTQRYCKVSNLKVQRDYHQAMERIVSHYQEQETS
jgi:site-specific recombinase XerD